MDATAASAATERFTNLIDRGAGAAVVAAHLDALSPDERIAQCRELTGKQMARLWDLAAAGGPLALDDFVAPSLAEGRTVQFAGKNSLPAFSLFEKHFARHEGAMVGINVQTLSFANGPGYFTVDTVDARPGEVRFDYTRLPATPPPGWPPVRSNSRGLSFFIYRNQYDYNRRVARDVIIGFATLLDKPRDAYYVLARKP